MGSCKPAGSRLHDISQQLAFGSQHLTDCGDARSAACQPHPLLEGRASLSLRGASAVPVVAGIFSAAGHHAACSRKVHVARLKPSDGSMTLNALLDLQPGARTPNPFHMSP